MQELGEPPPRWLDGFVGFSRFSRGVVIPYWALIAIFALFAATPWVKWRFSLRTLLVLTAIVAAILGLVVASW